MVKYFKVLDENGCSCHGGEMVTYPERRRI